MAKTEGKIPWRIKYFHTQGLLKNSAVPFLFHGIDFHMMQEPFDQDELLAIGVSYCFSLEK